MKRNDTINWMEFLIQITDDKRLSPWHLALLTAIIKLAYLQNEKEIIHVSRSRLMDVAHINTIHTYHKYFKQIQDFGIIKYTPSYHPGYRSTLEFVNLNLFGLDHKKNDDINIIPMH